MRKQMTRSFEALARHVILHMVLGSAAWAGRTGAGSGPDLVVDQTYLDTTLFIDTVSAGPSDCYIQEGCLSGDGVRKVLRFGTMIGNVGNEDFVLGRPGDDYWEWSECHGHWHYEDYAYYEVTSPRDTGMGIGFKNGWCVMDLTEYGESGNSCNTYTCDYQGISAGCADYYVPELDCQWVDMTGLPDGPYTLRVTTNPEGKLFETNYSNNSVTVDFLTEGDRVRVIPNFVEFHHDPLTDTENMGGPYPVSVKIISYEGNKIIPETATVVSGRNGVLVEKSPLTAGEPGEFTGGVPWHGLEGDLSYYFTVRDTSGRWLRDPPASSYSFHVGPDGVPPTLVSVTELEDVFGRNGSAKVSAVVTDNIGVKDVSIYYTISSHQGDTARFVPMTFDGATWTGDLVWNDVPWHTLISYSVVATDISSQHNTASTDAVLFQIVNWWSFGNWERQDLSGWDTGDGWGIYPIGGDFGFGVNDSPGTTYGNNADNMLTKLDPIDLSPYTSAYLSFWHAAVLETGKDSGRVELSRNGTDWTAVATMTGVGVQRDELIDVSSYIAEGELRVRFRMTSDGGGTNHIGWIVDDVHLLVDTTLESAAVAEPSVSLPGDFTLDQNYPNPFNPATTIRFDLPEAGEAGLVIYDILGREVATLVSGWLEAGRHQVVWDGGTVSSGIYVYRLTSNNVRLTKKMVVMK